MNPTAMLKLAASTLILGTTMIGCSPAGQAMHPANASDAKLAKVAAKAAGAAAKALAAKDFASAILSAESAVAAMPRNAGYRMLLGQAYLGAGRFASAETAFADSLTLSPDNDRAALNLALVEIAVGKKSAAIETLGEYREKLAASDYGLALALAGDSKEAVRVLEIAVRATDADAKTRQNLALAYAIDGQWANAHTMVGQDLPAPEADARMLQWAEFVRPDAAADQVAALLGVKRAADTGQPTRLALAPSPAPAATQVAAVDLAVKPPVVEPVAVVPPQPAPVVDVAPPVFETAPIRTANVAPLIQTSPEPVKQRIVPIVARTAAKAPVPAPTSAVRPVDSGKFVVQLGAFESAGVSRDAWNRMAPRFGLSAYDPANSTARVGGANYVRLSVGGFATRAEATQVCTRIRNAGGKCFVRGTLTDKPAQWVQRGMPRAAKPTRMASR